MKYKIFEWLLDILLIIGIVTMSYNVGSMIVKDYINNGLLSIIINFIIGIPMLYVIIKIQIRVMHGGKKDE